MKDIADDTTKEPEDEPHWRVEFTGKAKKQKDKLPKKILAALVTLRNELNWEGPERTAWRNYGKISGKRDVHHCHLNTGRPRYVVVWKVVDHAKKYMEIRYVGTHENADYRLIN